MTKTIRIENADNSPYKVRVWVETLANGEWMRSATPILLDYPTTMQSLGIHSTQRLVVEEY